MPIIKFENQMVMNVFDNSVTIMIASHLAHLLNRV